MRSVRHASILLALTASLLASACAYAAPLSEAAAKQQTLVRKVGEARYTAPNFRPGRVRHMVMFRFRPDATSAQKADVTRRFLALATASRRNGRPLIVSIESGPQNSGENADLGLQYGYLVTFRSEGDRNFYVGRPVVNDPEFFDPAHNAFKAFAAPYLETVVVFDFTADTAH